MTGPPDELSIQTERALRLPSRESEEMMGVPTHEWEKLRRRVSKIPAPIANASTFAGMAVGGLITALMSLLALLAQSQQQLNALDSWVIPTFINACVLFFVLAVVFWTIHAIQRKQQITEAADICGDMDEIKSRYERGGPSAS